MLDLLLFPMRTATSTSTKQHQTTYPYSYRSPRSYACPGLSRPCARAPESVPNNDTCVTLPVPPHLRDWIVRGEFVQCDDLLIESMSNPVDDSLNLVVIGDGHLRIQRSSTEVKRQVCNLGTWLEAWIVFCRVLVEATPELAPNVLQYQPIITEASAKYSEDVCAYGLVQERYSPKIHKGVQCRRFSTLR